MSFMKNYKVITAISPEEAEEIMNQMALRGWTVKAVTPWETAGAHRLAVTFEKEA